jgi:ATP-dependent Clp protease ATP-binding subunit ClpC
MRITDEAIGKAVELASRYISGRFMPDKAIDVIDESGARVRLRATTKPPDLRDLDRRIEELNKEKEAAVAAQDFETAANYRDKADKLKKERDTTMEGWREKSGEVEGVVDEEVVSQVVSSMTGIPLTRLEAEEAERLLRMEEELHRRVVSQDDAIKAIAKAVRRSRAGLKDPRRPVGSFIFLGPTGVGKTHLARCLAEFMFGSEDALFQIDMSEYMEKHNVSRLIGAPPGYVGYEEGGQLTERIRRRPYAVVLLDEVEKAHPDVFNMLLQIMEEGRLTDSFGRHVDFRNVVLVMTSNIGAEVIKNQVSLGFAKRSHEEDYKSMRDRLMVEVDHHFRPEFLNRLDEVIVFRPLSRDDLRRIVDIEFGQARSRLLARGLDVVLTEESREFLIEKGYNPEFGARPLRRAIERRIEDPLSEEILRGTFAHASLIRIEVRNGELEFVPQDGDEATAAAGKATEETVPQKGG